MLGRELRSTRRGGLLLDVVLAVGIVIVVAFVLQLAGLDFWQLLSGAGKFFGF